MKTCVPWTENDIRILLESFAEHTNAEIAKLLRRRHTKNGIRLKAAELGLLKSSEHKSRVGARNNRWAEKPARGVRRYSRTTM